MNDGYGEAAIREHEHEMEPLHAGALPSTVLTGPFPNSDRRPAPIEFYALDRWHAVSYIRDLELPDELATELVFELGSLSHAGPVHVIIKQGNVPLEIHQPFAGSNFPPGDPFVVPGEFLLRPFDFVKV